MWDNATEDEGLTMDKEGYPDTHDLDRIRTWDPKLAHGLADFVRGLWNWQHMAMLHCGPDGKIWVLDLRTGGWSGNENIVEAMRANTVFWAMCWQMSDSGGHHVFEIRKIKEDGQWE